MISGASDPLEVDRLDIDTLPRGAVSRLRVTLASDAMGDPVRVPVIVARGPHDGPVVGLTAAIHGNEVNGLPVVHQVLRNLDLARLRGAVVGVPVLNVPGFHAHQRGYADGSDLNRVMPGRPQGAAAPVYAHRLLDRVLRPLAFLVDLHTASFGRVNSLYVRADLTDPVTAALARLQPAQILVHNKGADGTLRSAAATMGLHAITVEVGNPLRFQKSLIRTSVEGIENVLVHLGVVPGEILESEEDPVVCRHSYWLYTDRGGLLEVFPGVTDTVRRGEVVARLTNIYGDVLTEYRAPEDGVVVGKSTNPVSPMGARILHLGIVGEP